MLVRATMPRKCVAYGEAQEKHTAAVTLPSRFFPSSLWGLERARSPYWIAPGKGRPFSQQEELILFECSLRSLKGGIFCIGVWGRFISEKPDHC